MAASIRGVKQATPSTSSALPTGTFTLRGGARLALRPVQPGDDWRLAELINGASEPARRQRFPSTDGPASPARLQALSCVDQHRHVALVVTHLAEAEAPDGGERVVAEARYRVDAAGRGAEFAVMVDERWQRRGIGTWLLRALSAHAARAGVTGLHGEVMADHVALLALLKRCGFRCTVDPLQSRTVQVALRPLAAPPAARVSLWRRIVGRPALAARWPRGLDLLSKE